MLEGLLEYEKAQGATTAVTDARARAEHYLLERRMLRSLTSGEVIDRRWTRFSFPTVWHYDVLRGLDYLRSAGVKPDERVAEAVALVEKRRHQNGRWPLDVLHRDRASDCRSTWKPRSARPAAGTRCAPCACWTGMENKTRRRPQTQKLVSSWSVPNVPAPPPKPDPPPLTNWWPAISVTSSGTPLASSKVYLA